LKSDRQTGTLDWLTILTYFILVFLGWFNIYAAVFDESLPHSLFNLETDSGKQLLFIGASFVIIVSVLVLDFKFYDSFAYIIYFIFILLLISVLFFGIEVAGSLSWFQIGGVSKPPS